MSKMAAKGKFLKKTLPKIDHSSSLRVIIPAGMANAKPPLGSQLGQRNINVANFCNDFNKKTENIIEGMPLPCRVKVKADGTYDLVINNPPATYFLKQAAGIERGKMCKGEIAGRITLKHLYEIACIKSQDRSLALLSLEQVCKMLVGIARTCGIEVVHKLDPVEHEEFMRLREENVQIRLEDMRLSKEAKMLRTT
ncbi:39S ribosomal protein L11, mitochondrial [Colletes gigas]|uniref:39S ribosomal protein L11, mitochondrial n=1 Tax=Colletes gigas TaxID=935657 RepID=UPI001C9B3C10|nr:39S ribosomal protein L11, mitochondrial [Colletes gigas]